MNVTINEGGAFIISNEIGDVVHGEDGLYDSDTRFLNRYEMFVNGKKPMVLTGRQVDYYSAIHYLTNPKTDETEANLVSIERKRFIGRGLHEDIDITNYSPGPVRFKLRLEFDADFASIFQVKAGKKPTEVIPKFSSDKENLILSFKYRSGEFYRETRIVFGAPVEFDGRATVFDVKVEPRRRWHVCIDFLTLTEPKEVRPKYSCESFEMGGYEPDRQESWIRKAPRLITDYDLIQHAYDQSLLDMAALRLKDPHYTEVGIVPAAGIPWYVTCFGRDSIITAYQTLPYLPDMTYGVLKNLVRYQGKVVNPDNEEEPGKILHEIRWGGSMATRNIQKIYYGTIDATPLFIVLLAEMYRWTADKGFIKEFKEPLHEALEWMDKYGDKDGDGYIEYKRMGNKGLENQGWKDSFDSVRFSNGRFAEAPIALCEVQGYVYMAKLGAAELLDALGDSKKASALRVEASELKEKFNRDFWMEEEGFFAEALDKDKNRVDSITSNPGHLLWSGIVEEDKAETLKRRLFAPDMFSGWGIRTMSSIVHAYNAMSYHNGSIWPHDNSIIAAGLVNYGFYEEALRVIDSILDAGQYFAYQRLPELFCGFERRSSHVPVDYPAASAPQAWASGTSMLMLSAMLGMKANAADRVITLNPQLPSGAYRMHLVRLKVGDSYVSFEVFKEENKIRVNVTENPGNYKVMLEDERGLKAA